MKRIFCITFISVICSFSFLTGYCSLYSVPVYGAQDQWEDLTSNEQLVDAFRAYCKSRNTVIDGSLLDAVTSFTTTTFNNLCNTLGIDVTLLQAELQRSYTGSGYKYAFSQLGLSTYNRIFAEFLQNNDLAVGDSVDNKILYDGEFFTDDNGNSCLVYVLNHSNNNPNDTSVQANQLSKSLIIQYGTPLVSSATMLSEIPLNSYKNYSFTINGIVYSGNKSSYYSNSNALGIGCFKPQMPYYPFYPKKILSYYDEYYPLYVEGTSIDGCITVFKLSNGSYAIGNIGINVGYGSVNESQFRYFGMIISSNNQNIQSSDVYITTNNTVINNETVINEGDTYIIDSDGEPGGGGSGGGSDDDDNWNPVLPDVPGAGSDPSGGNTIDWPDLDLPDFDLPNFSLGDLRLKFPFSIPFDIVSILGVINAPAVAPVIQEDIPIRIDLMNVDYTIPINLDMSDSLYDNFAVLVRAVEFIGFCIGLIHLTIRLVKG